MTVGNGGEGNVGFYFKMCHKLLQALDIRKLNGFIQLLS